MRTFPTLRPAAALYGAAVEARLALYRARILRVQAASRPVISVGNVAAGGTGKTPFVRWLAGELLARGHHPSILTRGYGRRSRRPVVVSDGAGHVASVEDSGDEPVVLARALPRVPIVADARRTRGAALVESLFPSTTVHLLDDGFSHVALQRDVDIALVSARDPEAGGRLLPEGRLREPLHALQRADVIVLTRVDEADAGEAEELARRYANGTPVFHAKTEVLGISDADGAEVSSADLPPGTLVGVAGIASPASFLATLERLRISPAAFLAFPDHARYDGFRLGRILRAAEEAGATAVITTEKDAVKLQDALSLPVYRVRMQMRVLEPGFVTELLGRLGRPLN